MFERGLLVGVVLAGGAVLAALAAHVLLKNKDQEKEQEQEPSIAEAPPPPAQTVAPDSEDVYDHEMNLVLSSLPVADSLEFGRFFDSLGSLIVSCPSHEGSARISDVAFIAIAARNRIWGLNSRSEYGDAVIGLNWAETEMGVISRKFSPSPEWLASANNVSERFFGLLRKTPHQCQMQKTA